MENKNNLQPDESNEATHIEGNFDDQKNPNDLTVNDARNAEDEPFAESRTLGEKRLGIDFQRGNNERPQNLMEYFAHGIDRVEKIKSNPILHESSAGDRARCVSVAQTKLEEAAMWAMKAANF